MIRPIYADAGDILLEVAQNAIDLDFDGLIIESHIDPDKALERCQTANHAG